MFAEWGFQPLGMTFDENGIGDSIFSREPAKYCYTITGNNLILQNQTTGPRSYRWTHKLGYTDREAAFVASEINNMSEGIVMAGGFGVAEYWFHDGNNEEIENLSRNKFGVGDRGLKSGRERALNRVNEARLKNAK